MQRKPYNASAVKHCFWFQEFRKTIELLESGSSLEEIKTLCETENIFDCATPARARQIYHVVSARVRSLDSSFYPVFMRGDLSTKKLTALIAPMANDTLLFDLVYEVIRDKLVIGVQEFSSGDVRAFFGTFSRETKQPPNGQRKPAGNLPPAIRRCCMRLALPARRGTAG